MSDVKQTTVSAAEPQVPDEQQAKLDKIRKRRRRKRLIKYLIYLLILAIIVAGGLWYWQTSQAQQAAADATVYLQATAQVGSLDKYIYGTGTIAAASQPTVSAQTTGSVEELRVEVGDTVEEGQILVVLENDDLDEEIRQLEYDLWSLDSEISSTSAGSEVTSISSPAAGRVVALYGNVGDDSLAIYRDMGSVAIISTDGRMSVEFTVSEETPLTLGDAVTLVGEDFTAHATITDLYMQGTRATATVTDDTFPMDSAVTVQTASGETAGEGTLVINKPIAVSAFGGTIKEVRVSVGESVSRKQTIYTLEDSPNTLKLEDLRLQRESALASLDSAKENRENLIVRAPVAGVIATVNISEDDNVDNGTALLSILEGEDMVLTIAVDELDVVSVEEGQQVIISVDALPDLSIVGTVERVAPVGSGDGGVTTYDVRLNFDSAGTGVRSGMNASGQVQVAHVDDALQIPAEALMTINNQTFVLVAGDGTDSGADSSAQPQAAADSGAASATDADTNNASTESGEMPAMASGDASSGQGSGQRPDFSNMSEEEIAQMREQRGSDGGTMPEGVSMSSTQGTTTTSGEGTLRAVTTGIANDDYVQILSGLSAGEVVLYQSTGSDSSSSFNMGGGGGGGGMMTMMF